MKLYAVLRRFASDKDYFHIGDDGQSGMQYFSNIMDAKRSAADCMNKNNLGDNHCVIYEIEVHEIIELSNPKETTR